MYNNFSTAIFHPNILRPLGYITIVDAEMLVYPAMKENALAAVSNGSLTMPFQAVSIYEIIMTMLPAELHITRSMQVNFEVKRDKNLCALSLTRQ